MLGIGMMWKSVQLLLQHYNIRDPYLLLHTSEREYVVIGSRRYIGGGRLFRCAIASPATSSPAL